MLVCSTEAITNYTLIIFQMNNVQKNLTSISAAVYNVRCNYLSQKLLQHAQLICIKYRHICIKYRCNYAANVTLPSLLGPFYHGNDFLNWADIWARNSMGGALLMVRARKNMWHSVTVESSPSINGTHSEITMRWAENKSTHAIMVNQGSTSLYIYLSPVQPSTWFQHIFHQFCF